MSHQRSRGRGSNNRNQNFNQRKRQQCKTDESSGNVEDMSPVAQVFLSFQTELDARYDKYERLVKKSRDLTIESKRIIFLLHRVSNDTDNEEILQQAKVRLDDLYKDLVHEIAIELTKREVFQYIRAFSPGLQEFVEAVSFYYYLRSGNIVNIEEVHNPEILTAAQDADDKLSDDKDPTSGLPLSDMLTPTDFMLGIADLTGELMRKCINSVASGDIDEPFKLCFVLQNIHEAFLTFSNHSRELKRKLFTLQSSLRKVENACYAIKIRGSEIPKHMLADFFSNEDEFQDSGNCDD